MKNGKLYRDIIKELNGKGISNNSIAKELGIDLMSFTRYLTGSREPSDDIINRLIINFKLDRELLGEPKKEEPVWEEIKEETPIKVEEEPVVVKEKQKYEIDMNEFLKKFNALSDFNKKTVVDMVDSLTIVEQSEKNESKGLKLKMTID